MMKTKLTKAIGLTACSVLIVSCSNETENQFPSENLESTTVHAKLAEYESTGSALPGENDITDMKAFLFKNGEMANIYELSAPASNTYNIQVDSRSGNLYVIAYTGGSIPTEGLLEKGLNEEAWKSSIIDMTDRQGHYYTGMTNLENANTPGNTANISLKRGLARFDLAVNSIEEISIKDVTLRNLAHSAYVFPQDGILSPSHANRKDTTIVFPQPITDSQKGMLYTYEQENEGIEVCVTASIGGVEKELTKSLDGPLKRNTIYTIIVRQDYIDIKLDVTFEDWEEGGNTELTPYSE